MKPEKLSAHLGRTVNAYAEKVGAVSVKSELDDSYSKYKIEFEKIIAEFVYSKKASDSYPISTLYCRLYLDKESGFFFEIPEIIGYLDLLDYHAYHYAFIESPERMDACFSYITDFLEYRNEEIESLIPREKELEEEKIKEVVRVYKIDTSTVPGDEDEKREFYRSLNEYVSSYTASRFTTGKAFSAYIHGDFDKALEEYKNQDELLACEKRIADFISDRAEPYQAMPLECASILEVEKYKKDSFKMFLMTLAVSVLGFFTLFFIIQLIINARTERVTVLCDNINPLKTALIGTLTGLVFALSFRDKIEPLLLKNKKEAFEFSALLSEHKALSPIKIVFIAVFIISIVAFADYSRPALKMYDDKIMYNSHARPLNHYSEYYLKDFYDIVIVDGYYSRDFNRYTEKPFYVIQFSGDRYINLKDVSISDKKKTELVNKLRYNRESDIPHVRSIESL